MNWRDCVTKGTRAVVRAFHSSLRPSQSGALALLAVIAGISLAAGQEWHPLAADQRSKLGSCNITEEYADGLSGDPGTDVLAERGYMETIAAMLKDEKFDELDCLADRARSSKERFPGGEWKLHTLYQGLSAPAHYPAHTTDEDWDALTQQLQRWVAARPKSVTARVALAAAYVAYAGDARGDEDANPAGEVFIHTLSPSGRKLFTERTTYAQRSLSKARSLSSKCPEWYVVMLQVAQNQQWNESKRRKLLERAISYEPGYYYYVRVVASNLLQRWGGKPGDFETFARDAADRVGGEEGDLLYFQIVTASNLFSPRRGDNPQLSLERMKRGFTVSEKQYGSSLVNLNRVAYLAFYARPDDELFASKAFARIGDQWDVDTWKLHEEFVLAKNVAVFMGERLSKEAAAADNMKTPEGLRYRASFEKPYEELVRQCVRLADGVYGKFQALTSVGATGTIEDVRISGENPPASCLFEKLRALSREKATPFPPPPQAPYWVGLDLDWADFAQVAAK